MHPNRNRRRARRLSRKNRMATTAVPLNNAPNVVPLQLKQSHRKGISDFGSGKIEWFPQASWTFLDLAAALIQKQWRLHRIWTGRGFVKVPGHNTYNLVTVPQQIISFSEVRVLQDLNRDNRVYVGRVRNGIAVDDRTAAIHRRLRQKVAARANQ